MGNSSTKESSSDSSRPNGPTSTASTGTAAATTGGAASSSSHRSTQNHTHSSNGHRRGSTPDLSFLGIGGSSSDRHGNGDGSAATEARRETKAEKEARKLEKERAARVKERERSIREEHVDGGYLVTMGTYTAAEDFWKAVVRQLIIERRIAPFWRGLNDFSSSWTEHQIVAAARDLPIPAPDEIPPEFRDQSSQSSPEASRELSAETKTTQPAPSQQSPPYSNDYSSTLSPSHPAFLSPSPSSSLSQTVSSTSPPTASPLFRGRSKTLASLSTFRNSSQADMTPQEMQLPKDPLVNGQPVEVFLYKDAAECPICFLYYPPYLNKSRCCDQPICSECFVQIKRPEPHPPESLSPDEDGQRSADAAMLVSEPAQCPFCTEPEFGVTYDPPPFRRGLVYGNQAASVVAGSGPGIGVGVGVGVGNGVEKSAMSSSSSLASHGQTAPQGNPQGNSQGNSQGNPQGQPDAQNANPRRRATSLSATSPAVITTDRIRPDWAKKLADARAQAMRRSAAATALHNAAYLLNSSGSGSGESRGFGLGRRRRQRMHFAGDGHESGSSGSVGVDRYGTGNGAALTARIGPDGMTPENMMALFAGGGNGGRGGGGSISGAGSFGGVRAEGIDSTSTANDSDLFPGRSSSRRTRVEELEDMMMMEAIRQSLQAEEERKKKEDKEASKEAKKEGKRRAKEEKEARKAEKAERKRRGGGIGYSSRANTFNSVSSSTTSTSRSTLSMGGGRDGDDHGGGGGADEDVESTCSDSTEGPVASGSVAGAAPSTSTAAGTSTTNPVSTTTPTVTTDAGTVPGSGKGKAIDGFK